MINKEKFKDLDKKFYADRANVIGQSAVTRNGITESVLDPDVIKDMRHSFSLELKQGEITDQKQSGRCWMFSALNTMRYRIIKDYKLETFELSQAYPLFFDKLEKSNYFLESIIKTLDEDLQGRLVKHILADPLGDGGQWDMFVNLVNKYGVVPKYAMPEVNASSATREMDSYLTKMLRSFAKDLRKAHQEGKSLEELEKMKDGFNEDIYRALTLILGTPPKTIDFEARDKDDNYICDKNLSPKEFFDKYVKMNIDDFVSLINAPTADKPFNETFTVDYLGNVCEGKPVKYLNLPIDELKKAAIRQLEDGYPVWMGCDVGQSFVRKEGILSTKAFKLEELFGLDFAMTKEDRLDYSESLMTHAMVFTGVDLDDEGNPIRWKIENSWGDRAGNKGYLVMSDEWFNEYMYQIAVDKKYLTDDQKKAWEKEPIHLKPWDPMGSLAK
ncbi:aminopeptidase C [Anaerococcus tetradius]|uniref:Aminopeptidase n=1 Tax=Anaerococcus tetradius TaxID=33036 RepID=A0A133KCJ4_9FIRM|nr:C1 family peptidase [Anaerococcus tetradius]KWZ77292.1 putative aminopeptidase [Anaerococcus tetradius]